MGVVILRLSNSKPPGEDILYATPEAQKVIERSQNEWKKKVKSKVGSEHPDGAPRQTAADFKELQDQIKKLQDQLFRLTTKKETESETESETLSIFSSLMVSGSSMSI
eukprot:SAG11_NODE_12802_length_684_cov_1.331624_3_plen_108_part_00